MLLLWVVVVRGGWLRSSFCSCLWGVQAVPTVFKEARLTTPLPPFRPFHTIARCRLARLPVDAQRRSSPFLSRVPPVSLPSAAAAAGCALFAVARALLARLDSTRRWRQHVETTEHITIGSRNGGGACPAAHSGPIRLSLRPQAIEKGMVRECVVALILLWLL